MDITFTCKCGQEIVIDEAGAGITVDCPGCGKPVYVPSKQPPKAKDTPVRVETPLPKQTPPATPGVPASRPPKASLPSHKREDIHPSIQASLACLLILAGLLFVGKIVTQNDPLAVIAFPYVTAPLTAGVALCAIYAMCIGHVKHGLLLLAGLTLLIALYCWILLHSMLGQLPRFPH
jgi:hypothetical protein